MRDMGSKRQCIVCMITLMLLRLLSKGSSVSNSYNSKKKLSDANLIKKVKEKGPYIGLITVFATEEDAFFAAGAFKPHPNYPFVDLSGRRFRVGTIYEKQVIYVRCGIGMVNAAAATQQMVDKFEIVGIVHFGISGNLNNSMFIGDVSIPNQFANTGLWNWINPNGTADPTDVSGLDIVRYNVPKGEGVNLLGQIGYTTEQFYSATMQPNTAIPLFWAEVHRPWLKLAATLEGIKLERCVNSSMCLPEEPKLVVGLRGSTANIFLDNAAYRDFLFQTFGVSTTDMESFAVVMTCLSNGWPVIVIRGMSDIAGGQSGENPIDIYGHLAAVNTVKVVLKFISNLTLPTHTYTY